MVLTGNGFSEVKQAQQAETSESAREMLKTQQGGLPSDAASEPTRPEYL